MTSPFSPLIQLALIAISLAIVWLFGGYPLLMTFVALRKKPATKDYSYQPFVSIIVPAYNEEMSIETRLDNLWRLNYPKQNYEIIVVDSASTDRTKLKVQRLVEFNANANFAQLSIVSEGQRKGKGSAIIAGMSRAKGDIILVTDANCVFNLDALREIAPHFKDPHVGAVGGRYIVQNPNNPLTRSAKFYRDLEHILRTGESALCSAVLFDGEMNAWRKDLGDIDPTRPTEDFEMCIKIRKKGYKIEYEPEAAVYEAAPTTFQEQVSQKKKNAVGTIKSILHNINYLAVPKDWYRLVLLPSHKGLAMLSPYLLLAVPVLYLAMQDWAWQLFHGIGSIIAFGLIFALLAVARSHIGESYKADRATMDSVIRMIWYTLLNAYIVLAAWKDVAIGNYSPLWEMVTTTREGGADGGK